MSRSLESCLDELKIEGPQRKYIQMVAARYREEGKSADEAKRLAMAELIDRTKKDIASVREQIPGAKRRENVHGRKT